ncbi:MAG TPA: cupin domain-containing protein [Cytophagales bacterium]|jgi:mannose-6-phosphate isomerase-like protein (cupin superfamily)
MNTLHHTKAGAGVHLLFGTDVVTIKATSHDTSGRMLVLEVTVPPGGGPPVLHRHAYTETFYFLAGTFRVSTAGDDYRLRTFEAEAGDTVTVPSRVWHNFRNTGTTPGRFLVVHSPADMEPLLQELGVPVADPLHPPRPAGPPSAAEMQLLLERLGSYMEFLPPDQIAG